jgi:Zn-dependent M28 family amino/carboxypeptidase
MTPTSQTPNKESNGARSKHPTRIKVVILSGARSAQSKDPDEARLTTAVRTFLPRICISLLLLLSVHPTQAQTPAISGQSIYNLTAQFLAAAPQRYNGSPGHLAAENFIKAHFKPEAAKGDLITDEFTASTPAGPQTMRNYIVRYPGKREGIIVLASHYETNYPLRDIPFVGANDGACTSALLIEIGAYLRTHPPQGYSVWLLFDDGEEAVNQWSDSDSLYGTRHLAAKWYDDGTLKRIRAFIVADMIGDKDLNILEEEQSTAWLRTLLKQAAANTHHSASVFQTHGTEDDDHIPFLKRGVPSLDIIDVAYGPFDQRTGDYSYHHSAQDTLDKISPQSLQISADLFLELIHLINQR